MKPFDEQILKRLKELGDPERAGHTARYFKTGKGEYAEGDRFFGIRVPEVRRLVKTYRGASLEEVLTVLASPWHEARLLALLMLVDQFQRSKSKAEQERIYRAYLANTKHINNWDLVDCSAHKIVGPYLDRRSRRPLYRLAKSASLWERRIAVIATFRFIREDDFTEVLALGELLLNDREDLIHKAVGWMLREAGKRDQEVLKAFLDTHATRMPRTMLRYAIERLPEATRQDYLRVRPVA